LYALAELCVRTWAEPVTFSLELSRSGREDRATNVDEMRRLLGDDQALADTTSIRVYASPSGRPGSLSLWWSGQSASLSTSARDAFDARALKTAAAAVLDAGAVDSPAEPTAIGRVVEQEIKLSLPATRFSGTYADLDKLVRDLADQVRQVRGSLDSVYVALTEPGHTITVHHLDELGQITTRDVKQLTHLSISLGAHRDGPSLSMFVARRMSASVTGPEEAPVRALRAAASDLLSERARAPGWLNVWTFGVATLLLQALAYVSIFLLDWPSIGFVLFGVALAVSLHPLYLPEVELLSATEKTRWTRWSRYIVGLGIAWLIGSLAIPIVAR
jgi:hypothetical protein